MRARNLRRKLRAWNRYANRLEKLGQQRIYNAHIHYIAVDTVRHMGSLEEVTWNWDEVSE